MSHSVTTVCSSASKKHSLSLIRSARSKKSRETTEALIHFTDSSLCPVSRPQDAWNRCFDNAFVMWLCAVKCSVDSEMGRPAPWFFFRVYPTSFLIIIGCVSSLSSCLCPSLSTYFLLLFLPPFCTLLNRREETVRLARDSFSGQTQRATRRLRLDLVFLARKVL